jgi:diguanylate cyclase (GGDEF)-like protein
MPESQVIHEGKIESPNEGIEGIMLQAKKRLFGEEAELSEEDKGTAEEISSLSGIQMLQAYEDWRKEIENTEAQEKFRRKLQKVIEQRDELEQKAYYDELTGARTRHFFTDFLGKAVRAINNAPNIPERRHPGDEFCLLALDIDHFKLINDRYGHNFGDQILKELVDVLKNRLRDDDVIVRHGGEEFFVFLRTDEAQAEKIGNELRELVAKKINQKHNLGKSGTISMGIVSYSPKDDQQSEKELMERADTALYHAKRTGRNKVSVFNPEMRMKEGEKGEESILHSFNPGDPLSHPEADI